MKYASQFLPEMFMLLTNTWTWTGEKSIYLFLKRNGSEIDVRNTTVPNKRVHQHGSQQPL